MGKGLESKGAGLSRAVRRSLGKRVRRAAWGGGGAAGRWPPSALPAEVTPGAAPAARPAVLRVPGGAERPGGALCFQEGAGIGSCSSARAGGWRRWTT